MESITARMPWAPYVGELPLTLDYYEGSMYGLLSETAEKYPDNVAFDFMGKSVKYKKMLENIDRCAAALKKIGVKEKDRVTVALPNCPQAIYVFYAINAVGAVANMIHPLSAEKEIEFYLNASKSEVAVTLDQFYPKFASIIQNTAVNRLVIARIKDELPAAAKIVYSLTQGKKLPAVPDDGLVIRWKKFISGTQPVPRERQADDTTDYSGTTASPEAPLSARQKRSADPAVILYSGGTTGTTKGIVLTNKNFNALADQVLAANPMFMPGDRMLAAMPLFHGFGLGVCIHTMLARGGRCVLVPRFTPKTYGKLITKYRCNFIAGVPTLYEALLRLPTMKNADLSSLKGVFSGGDSLSVELKKKLDRFLEEHHAKIRVREGYGTTETVTACCLTPPHMSKEGSIGLPFPDTYIKIVEPGTERELPYGEEGEILLAGPTVMKEYMDNPEETAATLRRHADGLTWVYTGDLGTMDDQGFIYFRGRAKRMIVTSGYNVYPGQLENVLDAHPLVQMSCVIGVPDPVRIQKVKAFVKLAPGAGETDQAKSEIRQKLMDYCRKNIARYALPYDIEFRDDMPKTLVGKVAYRKLEEEELAKTSTGRSGGTIADGQAAVNASEQAAGNAPEQAASVKSPEAGQTHGGSK